MGENRLMCDLYEENQRLKERIKELNELKEKAVLDICRREARLREAKQLLKAAVEDIRYCMRYYNPCEVCALLEENGECAAADDDDCEEKYKWRCEAEALALIGEEI